MSWATKRRERREAEAIERARLAWNKPKTAFVLSGGGVLGAVQVGQLRAVLESGVVPDLIVGTSVGALNGAMAAARPTAEAMRQLEEIWCGLRTEDLFPGSRVARVWNLVARGDHIHSNDGIRRLVDRLPAKSFEDLSLPLHVCATNLSEGAEHWFDSGPLSSAILASTALPGVYPPITIDGVPHVDGGVLNNVPISRAARLGAQKIFVFTCGLVSPKPRPIRRPVDVLIQSFTHARNVRVQLDVDRYRTQAEIVMLPVFDTGFVRYNDPTQSRQLIRQAYEISRSFLRESRQEEA